MDSRRIDVEACRARLHARREMLADVSATAAEASRPVALDQARVGRLSRADALRAQAMAQEAQRRRRAELRRIDAALSRIDDGTFGYCLLCGKGIETARLEADPTMPTCMECASASDGTR